MNWFKLWMILVMFLVALTTFLMGAWAYAAYQYENTLAMWKMIICIGCCIMIGIGVWKEIYEQH